MSYGTLDAHQSKALASFVKGRSIFDFGAGDCKLSQKLLKLGATGVQAVDQLEPPRRKLPCNLRYLQRRFRDLDTRNYGTIFISWPTNDPGCSWLATVVSKSDRTIYLGKNTDGTACGNPEFFRELVHRELLAYVPSPMNTLIIVGERLPTKREPMPEELAGLTLYTSPILAYRDIEKSPRYVRS